MIYSLGDYKVDLDTIETPARMLELMLYTLGHQALTAKTAAEAFLAGGEDKHAQAQVMVTMAGTVGAFIWTIPSRKQRLSKAFPRRAQDIQDLLGLSENQLLTLKGLRDGMIHLDERIEELWIADPKRQVTMWMVTEAPVKGGNLMSWNPATKVFSFLEHEVSVPDLIELLDLIQKRSMTAFTFMMLVEDVEEGDEP